MAEAPQAPSRGDSNGLTRMSDETKERVRENLLNGRRSISELFQKTCDLVEDWDEDELSGSDDSWHRRRRPFLEVRRNEFPDGSDLTLLAEETNSDEISEEDPD